MSDAIRPSMLYDGLCGICHGAVQFVIRRETHDRFRFAAQQSELAAETLERQFVF